MKILKGKPKLSRKSGRSEVEIKRKQNSITIDFKPKDNNN